MKEKIKRLSRFLGYEVIRFIPRSSNEARLKHFLAYYNIDLVLDVGANIGQFASSLRELGYKSRIVSFEPVSSTYSQLELFSRKDKLWQLAPRSAVGDRNGEIEINISANSVSSSVLPMFDAHRSVVPDSAYSNTEIVALNRLDVISKNYIQESSSSIFLKVDVQGFEKEVIEGAKGILHLVNGIELEMSIVPLYEGQLIYTEMIEYLDQLGYELYAVIPDFTDPKTGRMLQMDGIFIKKGVQ